MANVSTEWTKLPRVQGFCNNNLRSLTCPTSSLFAYQFSAQEAASMMGINACFHLAMFTALVWLTSSLDPHLYPSEAYLILLFCICGTCSTFLTYRRLGRCPRTPPSWTETAVTSCFSRLYTPTIGGIARRSMSVAISIYGIWFAFRGLDGMVDQSSNKSQPCGETVFFFAPVSLYGWFRTFLKVLFVCGAIVTGTSFSISLLGVVLDGRDFLRNWMEAHHDSDEEEAGNQESGAISRVHPSAREMLVALAVFALFMVAVELTLVWNHISAVYTCSSTGQLFPLVIGIGGMLRLGYILSRSYIKGSLRFVGPCDE